MESECMDTFTQWAFQPCFKVPNYTTPKDQNHESCIRFFWTVCVALVDVMHWRLLSGPWHRLQVRFEICGMDPLLLRAQLCCMGLQHWIIFVFKALADNSRWAFPMSARPTRPTRIWDLADASRSETAHETDNKEAGWIHTICPMFLAVTLARVQ